MEREISTDRGDSPAGASTTNFAATASSDGGVPLYTIDDWLDEFKGFFIRLSFRRRMAQGTSSIVSYPYCTKLDP